MGHLDLPVIKLRTDFLRYNVNSGRTHKARLKWLANHPELGPDFFDDPESPRVQEAMNDILVNMAEEADLAESLRVETQQEPAIITKDGYVVNGNRRLAALRQQGVDYMDAVVLPETAQDQEIYELELALQMAPETKAGYNWVDELLHIRFGIDRFHESEDQLMRRMHVTVDELRFKLRVLSLVDEYLEWKGATNRYDLVGGLGVEDEAQKIAFEELQKRLDSEDAARLEDDVIVLYKNFAFQQIDRGEVYREMRRTWNQFRVRPTEFVQAFMENYSEITGRAAPTDTGQRVRQGPPASPPNRRSDPFGTIAGILPGEVSTSIEGAVDLTAAPRTDDSVREALRGARAEFETVSQTARPAERLQQALNALEEIDFSGRQASLAPGTRFNPRQLFGLLNSLERKIKSLRDQLQGWQRRQTRTPQAPSRGQKKRRRR